MANKIIFVCYRRNDSSPYSTLVAGFLRSHWGKARVFRDLEHIPPGAKFLDMIDEKLAATSVMLVIIGPRWVDEFRARTSVQDYVLHEISTALRAGCLVVPVHSQQVQFPPSPDSWKDLPDDRREVIEKLSSLKAWSYPDEDVARQNAEAELVRRIQGIRGFEKKFFMKLAIPALDCRDARHRLGLSPLSYPHFPHHNRSGRSGISTHTPKVFNRDSRAQ